MGDSVKVVLLGDSGVGKTSIVQRFAFGTFKEENAATLGAMFIAKILEIPESNMTVKFQIWDTAGQEKYRSLAQMYYQDAAVAVLVYDITKRSTFDGMKVWLHELKEKAPTNILTIIAANKSDLVEAEQVEFAEAKTFADDEKAVLKMTSAKDGMGIQDIFVDIARLLNKVEAPASTSAPVQDGVRCFC
jgi:Ras-related protein Rab-5C